MRQTILTLVLVAGLVAPQAPVVTAQGNQADADLTTGIRQVREGEFEAALATLDGVVKRLAAQKGRAQDLARAYTYLAIAYVGMAEQEKARVKFLEAWRADRTFTLSPTEFPPSIIEAFERARKDGEREAGAQVLPVVPPPEPTAPRVASPPPEVKRRGKSKLPLVLLGGAVVAGGAALAAGGGGKDGAGPTPPPPALTATFSPAGTAIVSVTEVSFATQTNITSPVYTWDFGDGTAGSGPSPTHIFQTEGTFTVRAGAAGNEGLATTSLTISVRSVSGMWGYWNPDSRLWWDLVQAGDRVTGRFFHEGLSDGVWTMSARGTASGTLRNSKAISASARLEPGLEHSGSAAFDGEFNGDLSGVSGQFCWGEGGCWTHSLIRR